MSLPIGWGSRKNTARDDDSGAVPKEKIGDWSRMDMPAKYSTVGIASYSESQSVPFGFSQRHNAKTIEELSLDRSATNVAVAEVLLSGKEWSLLPLPPTGSTDPSSSNRIPPSSAAAIAGPASASVLAGTSPLSAPVSTSASTSASIVEAPANQDMIFMLAKAIVRMDQRVERMEQSLQLVIEQQQRLLALHERGV
jgi:hypothetical protein